MNKILKSILIIIVIIVGVKLVLAVENLLQLIIDNGTIISVIVAIISGLYVLTTGNEKDSEFRQIAIIILVISILIIVGQLVGSLMEKGMQGLLK